MKIVLSLLIICASHLSNGFKTPPEKRSWHHQGLGSPSIPPGVEVPPDQWFVQLLDHFKPTDDRTWWVSRNERMQKFCRGDNFLGFSRGPSIRVRKPQKGTWNQKTATLWIQGSGQVALCPPGPLPDRSPLTSFAFKLFLFVQKHFWKTDDVIEGLPIFYLLRQKWSFFITEKLTHFLLTVWKMSCFETANQGGEHGLKVFL